MSTITRRPLDVTKPIPMKRELKVFCSASFESTFFEVTKPIPMKRELKV